MSETTKVQHTPGPWRIDGAEIKALGAWVAHVRLAVDAPDRHAANARLIAAAPDLLRHGYALAMLALQSDRYAIDPEYRDETDNLLAAIAKARGES